MTILKKCLLELSQFFTEANHVINTCLDEGALNDAYWFSKNWSLGQLILFHYLSFVFILFILIATALNLIDFIIFCLISF